MRFRNDRDNWFSNNQLARLDRRAGWFVSLFSNIRLLAHFFR
jgi:hypothetical protein